MELNRVPALPSMAWLLRARPPTASLWYGQLVNASESGIFEGTWVGESGDMAPLRSTMPFGSGVLIDGKKVHIVTPGHMLEGVYTCRVGGELIASNSLSGLLVAASVQLDPNVAYPPLFDQSVKGVTRSTLPTTSVPIDVHYRDNLTLDIDGRLTTVPKPREQPFTSFAEHRRRLSDGLASAMTNAPSLFPVVSISSGFDSAAVAVLASELGCRRAVTIRDGKKVRGSPSLDDSGEKVARHLGLQVAAFDRSAYAERDDLPEADFLATGFTGEEVALSGMGEELSGGMLLTGFFGDGMWWRNRPIRPPLWRGDQSGSSLGEWRLRVGFAHVPLPCLGAEHHASTRLISGSEEMRPWRLSRRYDKPIPRRILEEAGVARGSFGDVKRAVSASIHVDGPAALGPVSLEAVERFAAAEGRTLRFQRRSYPLWRRAGVKLARQVGAERIARLLARPKYFNSVMEPEFGSLMLRWALSVVERRYASLGRPGGGKHEDGGDSRTDLIIGAMGPGVPGTSQGPA